MLIRRLAPSLLAFSVLVTTLTAQSIWWDEGISMHLAASPWLEVLRNRATNIHPPLYFLVLGIWTRLVGGTPFAARYLSALAMTLLPAAVLRFMARRFGNRAGRTGALLVALAPPFVVYGQEVRAYALLPLLGLGLLGYVWPARETPSQSVPGRQSWWDLAGLVALQTALLGLHYAGTIAVGLANLAFAARCLVRYRQTRDAGICRPWFVASIVTLLLAVPWVAFVASVGLEGMSRQAGLGNALASPVPAGYVAALLASFHVTGLPEALGDPALMRVSALVGVVLLVTAGLSLTHQRSRRPALGLLAAWMAPLLAAPVIWYLSPQAHPRYFFPFVLGGWLTVAYLITTGSVWVLIRGALLATASVASMLGLALYLFNPGYARSDVRAAARYIASAAVEGDVALIPHTDWSLTQYDLGPAGWVMIADPADDAAVAHALRAEISADSTVFLLDYKRDVADPRNQVRAMLTWSGMLVGRAQFHGVFLEVYEMAAAPEVPACAPHAPVCVAGSDFCLTGSVVQTSPVSGAAAPMHLCWDGSGPTPSRYALAARWMTPEGAQLSSEHNVLLSSRLEPMDAWPGGEFDTYHLVPVPVGALSRPYEVDLGLYDVRDPSRSVIVSGDDGVPRPTVTLGPVTPVMEPWREISLYGDLDRPSTPVVLVGEDLQIEGVAIDRGEVQAGEPFFVTVCWRVLAPLDLVPEPVLKLRGTEEVLAETRSVVDFASLAIGRPTCETTPVTVPADAEGGPAAVALDVWGTEVVLGDVTIKDEEHLFSPPSMSYELDARAGDVATLVGFDVAPGAEIGVGDPLTLTLVWRAEAGASESNLKVFTHLMTVDESALVAQHDAEPAEWTRPTSGWLTGEYIVDRHPMTWARTDLTGPAFLRVGFYDGETGAGIPWQDGEGGLVLPVQLSLREK